MVRDVVNPEPEKESSYFHDHTYNFGYHDKEPLDITAHYIKNNHRTIDEEGKDGHISIIPNYFK